MVEHQDIRKCNLHNKRLWGTFLLTSDLRYPSLLYIYMKIFNCKVKLSDLMKEFFDKYSVHQVLLQPVKLFGQPKTRDKIDVLNSLRHYADLSDIEYVYPLIFDKNTELASTAARIVSEVMGKVQGKQWNIAYDKVKYTKVNIETMDTLLSFTPEISAHLLGVSSLNSNGYVREKALRLASSLKDSRIVPYILLRLNDWVLPVRNLAVRILTSTLTADNIEVFIDNSYIINKLQNVLRVDLKSTRQEIVDYLKDDILIGKLKSRLRHPHVKTRLFCYTILADKIAVDTDIINFALKDKSFEIRMWLVDAIRNLEQDRQNDVIEKLLQDKSAKVKTAVLRNFENIVCLKFKEGLDRLVVDDHASVRDEARFISKKHLLIEDFPEFYRQQILINPVPGALIGLGETGNRGDYDIVCKFFTHVQPKVRLASMIAMWYLSKDDAVKLVLNSLDSDIPKIKKTAKQFLKSSKMPLVLFEMRNKLQGDNVNIKLFALEAICNYGGWQALEGVLFVIANDNGIVLDKAKELLGRWLIRASSIYSKPDGAIRERIINLFDVVRRKDIVPASTLKELSFLIETRR